MELYQQNLNDCASQYFVTPLQNLDNEEWRMKLAPFATRSSSKIQNGSWRVQ